MVRLTLMENDISAQIIFFNWDSLRAEKPLRGMESHKKKHKNDYRIQKICLERT